MLRIHILLVILLPNNCLPFHQHIYPQHVDSFLLNKEKETTFIFFQIFSIRECKEQSTYSALVSSTDFLYSGFNSYVPWLAPLLLYTHSSFRISFKNCCKIKEWGQWANWTLMWRRIYYKMYEYYNPNVKLGNQNKCWNNQWLWKTCLRITNKNKNRTKDIQQVDQSLGQAASKPS